ncbi:hypothetical protein [Pantoea sp. AS142]|uniref:hypothetical protein n=1 Tax=Pantoea sp. AS142 TaxID=3081292 RepID=UPI00301B0535
MMKIRKLGFMLFLTCGLSLRVYAEAPFNYSYRMDGYISGYVAGPSSTWPCYFAVHDKNEPAHGNYYHASSSQTICSTARMAYYMGENVTVWGSVDSGNNIAKGIEIRDEVNYWWNGPKHV